MANSVDPDQMLHSAASYLDLHCLQWPICLNTNRIVTVVWINCDCRAAVRHTKMHLKSIELALSNQYVGAFSTMIRVYTVCHSFSNFRHIHWQ